MSFQLVIRAIFLIYNYSFTSTLTPQEIIFVFLNGLKMDASMSGYFLALAGITLSVSVFTSGRWLFITLNTLTVFLLLFSSVVVTADLELYRHWGFRMDTTPLFYAGSGAAGSIEFSVMIRLLVLLVVLFSSATFVYAKVIAARFYRITPSGASTFITLILLTGLLFIPIRGSFSVAPMNTGFVYFHNTKPFANHAAINVIWNFLYSVKKGADLKYPENFYDKTETEKYFAELYAGKEASVKIFREEKPNIILFIVESFTADVIEPLGGVKGVTPNFNSLCREGILFENFYASGDRTDKGIISVLSGYPSQPATNIIKFPARTQRLPYLNHFMDSLGYQTSFVYGGDIDFANFRSYLTANRFDHITSEEDFDADMNESKWGIHDHIVLDRAFAECDTATGPFFKVILTLSSHEPFDAPWRSSFNETTEESLFFNACNYTDQAIGDFIRKAKASEWWQKTIVMFVADHGHRLPGNKQSNQKEKFRIPFLIAGGALTKGSVIHTMGGQTDIANTLLSQLGRRPSGFLFSKDLLAREVRSFAVYFYNNGYGFLTPSAYIVYDNQGKHFIKKEGATEEEIEMSKAYQQKIYTDYNKK